MASHPINFSGDMVRAILAGRKTQTRRPAQYDTKIKNWRPGDTLWVRETWRVGAWDEHTGRVAIDYRADNVARREWLDPTPDDDGEIFNRLWQQSTDDARKAFGVRDSYKWAPGQSPCRWRPSVQMPRWASRLTLTITDVRQERLHDISGEDAVREGLGHNPDDLSSGVSSGAIARLRFDNLWKSIYGADSWYSNPLVWVVSFEVAK